MQRPSGSARVRPSGDDPHAVHGGHGLKRKPIVHSRCVQVHVKDVVKQSVSILSSKSNAGEIPLVLIPEARGAMSLFLEIPTGVWTLLQRFGKDVETDIKPGLHLLPAWYRIAYVVTKQSCCYDAPVQNCPTADDVRVSVDVTLIFQIVEPHKFIYRLGAKNFDEFLSGTVEEAIRMLVRQETHQTVYALRGERADVMLKMLNDKFIESGVTFHDCKVTAVWLPDVLANSLEITTKMGKGMERLKTANEYEFLQIRQESEMQIEEIRRRQEQVLVAEAGRKRRAELEFEQRSVKAEENGEVAMIEANGKVEVDKLRTQTDLDRTKKQFTTWRITEIAKAEANSNASKIKADLMEEQAIIEASWKEQKMLDDAEVIKCEAVMEKEAIRNLAAKREHDLLIREKGILGQFAAKGSFNLIGTPGDKLVNAMLKGTFSQAVVARD